MVFNFTTGFIAIVAIQPLAAFVDVSADWLGIAQDNYTLKLAIFHTVFNLLGVVLMMPLIDRLVAFLERVLPDKIVVDGVEQPLFITDAVVDYPDAALVALTSETRHLAINAIEILTKALGLKFQDVLGDEPMKDVVARSRTVITMRMKELYRKKIKAIYGAILEFCVRAQPNMDGDQAERLYQLKTASHRIVETMKELRLLRRNMAEAIASPNEYVREQYDLMRIHLGEFLRATDRSSKEDDLAEISARYHALAQNALKDDPVANGTLDRLIRDRLITPEQGVSLTNDTSHVTHIYTWLMETAEIIFAATANLPVQPDETLEIEGNIGDPQKEVRRLLARSHDEIEERLRRIREGG
jgi:phosphate:Na+ symporter